MQCKKTGNESRDSLTDLSDKLIWSGLMSQKDEIRATTVIKHSGLTKLLGITEEKRIMPDRNQWWPWRPTE